MRVDELDQEIQQAGNRVHHTSPVVIQTPSGNRYGVGRVTVKNGRVTIVAAQLEDERS